MGASLDTGSGLHHTWCMLADEPQDVGVEASAGGSGSAARTFECGTSQCGNYLELRHQAGYWRAQHRRAVQREQRLEEHVADLQQRVLDLEEERDRLQAELRIREQQLFGASSEKRSDATPERSDDPAQPKRPRGQQPGSRGHGRRRHEHLPAEQVACDLDPEERRCPQCGSPYEPFPGTEDSQQVEIQVRAHRRVYRRKRYRNTCSCPDTPGIITAPAPPKLIPKGAYGTSVWMNVLLDKYLHQRPTHRLLQQLATHGIHLSQGTVTDELKRLTPLLEPIYRAICQRNGEAGHWHADETGWRRLDEDDSWHLWVFRSEEAVAYEVAPSRSSEIAKLHLGEAEGIVSADRYSAYKKLAADVDGLQIAFCWAHVRRDFVKLAEAYPDDRDWAEAWIERIGRLYKLHGERRRARARGSPQRLEAAEQALRQHVEQIEASRDRQLGEQLPPQRAKPLVSLCNHWDGLVLFLDHDELPLDNNAAERALRSPVVGRKNYYGSGARWSARLAAVMFSILATLERWGLNPRLWLRDYLDACAAAGGEVPEQPEEYLPWQMTPQRRQHLAWQT